MTSHGVVPVRSADVLPGDEKVISVWTYFNVLLRHRVAIIALPLLLAALAAGMALSSPRKYVASASFAPEEPGAGASMLGQLAAQFGVGAAANAVGSPAFYADLLKRRDILRGVVTAKYESDRPGRFSGSLVEFYDLEEPDSAAALRKAVRQLLSDLSVRTARSTDIVELAVKSTRPEISLQIVNRFLQLVNDYNTERRRAKASAELDFVGQQLSQAEASLNAAEQALAAFYGRNRQIANSPDLRVEESRLQLHVSQRQQVYLGLAQGREASRIEAARSAPFITIVERPEGFVEAASRGTVRRTLLGALVGLFFAVIYAFFAEYLATARRSADADYREFSDLVGSTTDKVRAAFAKRGRRSGEHSTG